jgi:peptidoglycan L-alanyl-D-glutamate endopeptidase CwlK
MKPQDETKPFESRLLEDLHNELQYLYLIAEKKFNALHANVNVIRTCTYRNNAMQDVYYAKRPKITQARAGESPHNYYPSLAFDIAFLENKKLSYNAKYFKEFAAIILNETLNVTWGGNFKNFKDMPHFELTDWKDLI